MLFRPQPLEIRPLVTKVICVVTDDEILAAKLRSMRVRVACVLVPCALPSAGALFATFVMTDVIVDERCARIESVRDMLGNPDTRFYGAATSADLVAAARRITQS